MIPSEIASLEDLGLPLVLKDFTHKPVILARS